MKPSGKRSAAEAIAGSIAEPSSIAITLQVILGTMLQEKTTPRVIVSCEALSAESTYSR